MKRIRELTSELSGVGHQTWLTWSFLSNGQRTTLASATLLMAGVGYISAQIPLLLGALVDAVIHGRVLHLSDATTLLGTIASAYIAREVLQVFRKVVVEGTCTSVEYSTNVAAVSCVLQSDLRLLDHEQAGSLNGRLNRSVTGLVRLLKLSFLDLFPALFGAGFALAAALGKNLLIGLVMAGVVPIGLLVILFQLASQRGIRLSLLAAREKMDGTIVEQIGGLESVRASDTFSLELEKVREISLYLRRREFRHHIAMSLFDAVKSLNEGAFHIAVITFAIWLSLAHTISAGDILAFSILFLAVITPLREIHRIIDEAHESALRAENFFDLLSRPRDISFDTTSPAMPDIGQNIIIEARGLQVSYSAGVGKSRTALNNLNLKIERGEIVGFAGASGSGKTTLVRALLRLVHPRAGSLTIGGVPIEQVSRADIRNIFGFVSQTPFLFTGTISQNIAYGCQNPTPERIRDAARLARIHTEIEELPGGYAHPVSERGSNLSGGQRQRIALARVFLQDAPVLILDEATAALDNQNERAVMDEISNLLRGRTVIMVAHRQTSLQYADRILAFNNGEVVEDGTYSNLVGREGGYFANLVQAEATSIGDSASKCRQESHDRVVTVLSISA